MSNTSEEQLHVGQRADAGPREPARRGLRGSPGWTLVAAALGVMMVALDGTIVSVANPAIQAHLHASLADIQWVTNSYLLALAVTLITVGKVGDRFGHKKVFLTGIVGFALTSAAIGLSGDIAKSITMMIVFRVLQGVFGAMLQPTALALLRNTFPVSKLNNAIGVWGAVLGASTAAGPIVGGLLVQDINWESCFYVNVPVGIVALVVGLLVVKETPTSGAAKSFDIPGIALLSAFLFLLVWALIKGGDYGWGSGKTIGFFAAAVAAVALFILRESKTREPLLPLRLFRSVSLSAGTVLVLCLMFAMYGAMFFMTFFMENAHGLDPIMTGVRLLPMTGMMIIGAPLSGLIITKVGPKIPMFAGMLMAAAALYGLSRIGMASSLNDTIVWFLLLGLGLSPVMVGATEVIVGNAEVELAGVAGGLQSTALQVGGTIGTSVLGAVLSAKISGLLPGKLAGVTAKVKAAAAAQAKAMAAHGVHAAPGASAHAFTGFSGAQVAQLKEAASVATTLPVAKGPQGQVTMMVNDVLHSTFISGMQSAFLVAAVVAVVGALLALLTKKGAAEGHAPML
ncbi:MAG: MFS transporter [Streptosporangiales bacterium]|nr:MFS transporter [Streptosporangiales bacterium]